MPEPPSIRFIHEHVRMKRYRLTRHATIVRLERGITIAALEQALLRGEIIERYPDDQPYPSCLVLGWLASGDPLHVVLFERTSGAGIAYRDTVRAYRCFLGKRLQDPKGAKMSDTVDRCDLCSGELQPGKTVLTIWRGEELLVIRDVPADVCQQCDEAYISVSVSEWLDRFLSEYHQHRPERYLAVPQYAAVQAIGG